MRSNLFPPYTPHFTLYTSHLIPLLLENLPSSHTLHFTPRPKIFNIAKNLNIWSSRVGEKQLKSLHFTLHTSHFQISIRPIRKNKKEDDTDLNGYHHVLPFLLLIPPLIPTCLIYRYPTLHTLHTLYNNRLTCHASTVAQILLAIKVHLRSSISSLSSSLASSSL